MKTTYHISLNSSQHEKYFRKKLQRKSKHTLHLRRFITRSILFLLQTFRLLTAFHGYILRVWKSYQYFVTATFPSLVGGISKETRENSLPYISNQCSLKASLPPRHPTKSTADIARIISLIIQTSRFLQNIYREPT